MTTLADIDCNCNDCLNMQRDFDRYNVSLEMHRKWQYDYWLALQLKNNNKPFQFNRAECTINFGQCVKFNKPVSFIPQVCQLETQECFANRKIRD